MKKKKTGLENYLKKKQISYAFIVTIFIISAFFAIHQITIPDDQNSFVVWVTKTAVTFLIVIILYNKYMIND